MIVPLQIQKQPYHLLFIGGILIFLFSLFSSEQLIDITAYDTNYIIPENLIFLGFSAVLFLFWLVYKLSSRFFYSTILINIHVLLTTTGLLILIFFLWQQEVRGKEAHKFYDLGNSAEAFTNINSYLLITGLAVFIIQFIFLFNLLAGVFKKNFKDSAAQKRAGRKKHRKQL